MKATNEKTACGGCGTMIAVDALRCYACEMNQPLAKRAGAIVRELEGDPVACSGCGRIAEFLDLIPGAEGHGVFCLDCVDGRPIYEDPSSCATVAERRAAEHARRLGTDLARLAGLGGGS